jgi:hypothetical protein
VDRPQVALFPDTRTQPLGVVAVSGGNVRDISVVDEGAYDTLSYSAGSTGDQRNTYICYTNRIPADTRICRIGYETAC